MELKEPVSPTGQYLNSSALSLSVYAFLEFEVSLDDLPVLPLIKDVFLPINSRFSSIMVIILFISGGIMPLICFSIAIIFKHLPFKHHTN